MRDSLWLSPFYPEADAHFEEIHPHGPEINAGRRSIRAIYSRTPDEMKPGAAALLSDAFFTLIYRCPDRIADDEAAFLYPVDPDLINAFVLAAAGHMRHTRKDGLTPYIYHPIRVALDVFRGTSERTLELYTEKQIRQMAAAALCHDLVEDTSVTFTDIENSCGNEISNLVYWLTDLPSSEGNRATRKRLSSIRLGSAPMQARLIKFADIKDNFETSGTLGDFRLRFLEEKFNLLAALGDNVIDEKWLSARVDLRVQIADAMEETE